MSGVDFSKKQLDPESALNHKAQNEENAEQRMAFELYYRMGEDRQLNRVAQETGRHAKTIQGWAQVYRWTARIQERDKIAAEHSLTVQNVLKEQELKQKHVTVYDAAINRAVKAIVDGEVKIKTVSELIQLIDARWKLAVTNVPGANSAAPSMHFFGPTKVDLGLEKMSRDERLQFIKNMVEGLLRVNTRPKMGEKQQGTLISASATEVRRTQGEPADMVVVDDLLPEPLPEMPEMPEPRGKGSSTKGVSLDVDEV